MKLNSMLMVSIDNNAVIGSEIDAGSSANQTAQSLELAKRFTELGYNVDLITHQSGNHPAVDKIDGVRIRRHPFGKRSRVLSAGLYDLIEAFAADCLLGIRERGHRYGLVFSRSWLAGWAAQKIAEELKIPHVHAPHDLGTWQRPATNDNGSKSSKAQQKAQLERRIRLEFLIYQYCDHIIASTQSLAHALHHDYDVLERQVTVIPPGINENHYSPCRSEELRYLQQQTGLTGHDVLTVGGAAAGENYELLLNALPTLFNIIPDARLFAALSGSDSASNETGFKKLQSLAQELGIADSVQWLEFVPDDPELVDYYRAAGVFTLPSKREALSMTAVKAMACGTSTIVSTHSSLHNIIDFGHHALYADPHRSAELGAVLALPMLYSELAHKLSVHGSRLARRKFGWTAVVKRMLNLFDQVQQQHMFLEAKSVISG